MTELLIVGALTIDRFADGRSAPGGSVLHAGQAAVAEGASTTFLTVAGDEPEARDGLARLAAMGRVVHQGAARTASFRHDERAGRRVLGYTSAPEPIGGVEDLGVPEVVLFAPIADELPAATVVDLCDALRPRRTVMLIQGWLRRLELGRAVRPVPLADVPDELWSAFDRADALVVSSEDLAEAREDPLAQARALRARLGDRPLLVVTLGQQGYLLDDPGAERVVAGAPRPVAGAPTVGAGDVFGAALAVHLARDADPAAAAAAAAERVVRVLESRRP